MQRSTTVNFSSITDNKIIEVLQTGFTYHHKVITYIFLIELMFGIVVAPPPPTLLAVALKRKIVLAKGIYIKTLKIL